MIEVLEYLLQSRDHSNLGTDSHENNQENENNENNNEDEDSDEENENDQMSPSTIDSNNYLHHEQNNEIVIEKTHWENCKLVVLIEGNFINVFFYLF